LQGAGRVQRIESWDARVAVGNYISTFVQAAYFEKRLRGEKVAFNPTPGGEAVHLTLPMVYSR